MRLQMRTGFSGPSSMNENEVPYRTSPVSSSYVRPSAEPMTRSGGMP